MKKTFSKKYKQNQIKKLLKENEELDSFLYPIVKDDLDYTIYNLKSKKEEKIRSHIIEFHLSIESLLDDKIREFLIKGNPRIKKRQKDIFTHKRTKFYGYLDEFLEGVAAISFKKKLLLVRSMGLIDDRGFRKLVFLNKLRDNCGHIWILSRIKRKGVKRHKRKKPVLEYNGENLLNLEVFKDFFRDYSNIYLRMLKL